MKLLVAELAEAIVPCVKPQRAILSRSGESWEEENASELTYQPKPNPHYICFLEIVVYI